MLSYNIFFKIEIIQFGFKEKYKNKFKTEFTESNNKCNNFISAPIYENENLYITQWGDFISFYDYCYLNQIYWYPIKKKYIFNNIYLIFEKTIQNKIKIIKKKIITNYINYHVLDIIIKYLFNSYIPHDIFTILSIYM